MHRNAGKVADSYAQGGLISQAYLSLSYGWIGKDGKEVRTYQIQSIAKAAILKRLGNEILEKACSDAEQKRALHQQLNQHLMVELVL